MKKRVYAWVLSFFLLFGVLCQGLQGKAEVIHEADLEDYILNEMSEAHVMSMGISIVSPTREVYCASYGSETKTDGDYVLGELTQSFTAAAILQLSEGAEIALDDRLGKYLTEEKYASVSAITIRQLLNQTGGISVYERMSELQRMGIPGRFEAAPANYNLLGEVVEKVSGLSFEEYVADNILDPLEMDSTHTLRNYGDFLYDLVPGFRSYFGFPFEAENRYHEEDDWIQVSSGFMVSDVKDMGKYLRMYLKNGGDVLSKSSVSDMLYGKIDTTSDAEGITRFFDGDVTYGMGWLATKVYGQELYYYTGKSNNSTSAMFLLPQQKLGVVLLFNSVDYSQGQELLEKLIKGIISIELGETAESFQSEDYLRQHILKDIGLVLLVLAAWMPIFLIGVWGARRRNHMLEWWGILLDLLIHIGLPTGLLFWLTNQMPLFYFHRIYPDFFYVFLIIVGTLYVGAVIKFMATVVFAVLGPKEKKAEPSKRVEAATQETVSVQKPVKMKEDVLVQQEVMQEKKDLRVKSRGEKKPEMRMDSTLAFRASEGNPKKIEEQVKKQSQRSERGEKKPEMRMDSTLAFRASEGNPKKMEEQVKKQSQRPERRQKIQREGFQRSVEMVDVVSVQNPLAKGAPLVKHQEVKEVGKTGNIREVPREKGIKDIKSVSAGNAVEKVAEVKDVKKVERVTRMPIHDPEITELSTKTKRATNNNSHTSGGKKNRRSKPKGKKN